MNKRDALKPKSAPAPPPELQPAIAALIAAGSQGLSRTLDADHGGDPKKHALLDKAHAWLGEHVVGQ